MSLNKTILQGFEWAASIATIQNTWWSDTVLLSALVSNFGLVGILEEDDGTSLKKMNTAVSLSPKYQSTIGSDFPTNDTGFFRRKFNIIGKDKKRRDKFFYYFSSDKRKGPKKELTSKLAQQVHDKAQVIRISKRKHTTSSDNNNNNDAQQKRIPNNKPDDSCAYISDIGSPSLETTNNDANTTQYQYITFETETQLASSPQIDQSENYWTSTEAKFLFCSISHDNFHSPIVSIMEKMDICKTKGKVAMRKGKVQVGMQYHLLNLSYGIALKEMNTKNWLECCKKAITVMSAAGFDEYVVRNGKTICKWNRYFRNHLCLESDPADSIPKPFQPMLFCNYPEAIDLVKRNYLKELETVSVESFRAFILDNVVPELVETENDNLQQQGQQPECTAALLLQSVNLQVFSLATAQRYLKYLGFKYCDQKKTYYNDGHERKDNVIYRQTFINNYFSMELNQYLWVQIPSAVAIELENSSKLLPSPDLYYSYSSDDGTPMREYHIDVHPELFKEYLPNNLPFGGNLSVRKENDRRPLIVIGQDESSFSQYAFSSKGWNGPQGQSKLLPKSAGETIMVSAFQSRTFGFGRLLSETELEEINFYRQNVRPNYLSEESALAIHGSTEKPLLTNNSPFVKYFEVGVEKDGFWNYHQMALHTEDLVDCCQVLYPKHDFVLIYNQSSGHAKKRADGLNVVGMNLNWGGVQKRMRETTLDETCFGVYGTNFNDGDIQQLNFTEQDVGPFTMTAQEREERKHNKIKEGKVRKEKTKSELIHEMIPTKQFQPKKNYNKEDLKKMATQFSIDLFHEVNDVLEGWIGKPKGVLQILFERGFIDANLPLSAYSLDGRKEWRDENNEIAPRYLQYCLKNLLSECGDFKNEVTAMEDLCSKQSKYDCTVKILYSPKYHCEIAGEGIEYCWGMAKKHYRNLPLSEKKKLNDFRNSIKKSLSHVRLISSRKFAAMIRRYMLAYLHLHKKEATNEEQEGVQQASVSPPDPISFSRIEHFMKQFKTHRNVFDIDVKTITDVWKQSLDIVHMKDELSA